MNPGKNSQPNTRSAPQRRFGSRRGSTLVEYALTGIPLIFAQIGVGWLALSMWQYHTLQSAADAAAAYVAGHGAEYVRVSGRPVQIKDAAAVFAGAARRMPAAAITLTFTAGPTVQRSCRLDHCRSDTTLWPPSANNAVGTDIGVHAILDSRIPLASISAGRTQTKADELPGNARRRIVY